MPSKERIRGTLRAGMETRQGERVRARESGLAIGAGTCSASEMSWLAPTPESNTLSRRVDLLLAAGIAAAGASLVAVPARADIVYSGILNLTIPSTTAGIYLNLVTGVSGTTPGAVPGWDLNPWGTTNFQIWANNAAEPNNGIIAGFGTSTSLIDNLPVGTIINGSSPGYVRTGNTETTGATAFLLNSSNNYIGFRFLNDATGLINYGWAQFSLSATNSSQPRTLVAYAFDNSGAAISLGPLTPPMPEPGTVALLGVAALGTLAVRFWREAKPGRTRLQNK